MLNRRTTISGDHILQETLVPIPNTTVKLLEPMIVPKGAKVGHRRILLTPPQKGGVIFFAPMLQDASDEVLLTTSSGYRSQPASASRLDDASVTH